jgi:predicted Mrr-cat superfamily restriction endonuclease
MSKVQRALALLDQFEAGEFVAPVDAERLIVEVFEACGQLVTEKGFVQSNGAIDCFVRTNIDGTPQTIGIDVKIRRDPVGIDSILQLLELTTSGRFDRTMIVSRSGFSKGALRHAETAGLGQIDLFAPADIRNWLSKQVAPEDANKTYDRIVRRAMQELACLIAERPEVLSKIEWRELEKVLRETFEGIGFDTRLTRPGKDGGFDLELSSTEFGQKQTYLVEVKHWADQKPGALHLKKFISVTASKRATGGLLLSTSGFSGTIYSGITEFTSPVRLGEGAKIVALCRTYYRLQSALWVADSTIQEMLLSGTRAIGEH